MSYLDTLLRAVLPAPMHQFVGDDATHVHRGTSAQTPVRVCFADQSPDEKFPGGTTIINVFEPSQVPTEIERGDSFILNGKYYKVFLVISSSPGFLRIAMQQRA